MTKSEGEKRRDEGMRRVLSKNPEWLAKIRTFIEARIFHGTILTNEDIRERAKAEGIEEPNHPNAWGAMFNSISRPNKKHPERQLVAPYKDEHGRDVFRHMAKASSHARITRVYVRIEAPWKL